MRWPRQRVRKPLNFKNNLNPSTAKDTNGIQGSSVDGTSTKHISSKSEILWLHTAPKASTAEHLKLSLAGDPLNSARMVSIASTIMPRPVTIGHHGRLPIRQCFPSPLHGWMLTTAHFESGLGPELLPP